MPRRLLAILALLAVVFAILTALAVRSGVLGADGQGQGQAAIGGPFTLRDTAGPVDQEALKGKWSAVFFGFTYCPDVCPTTLFALGQAEARLGDAARDFQTVFISIDPARDTPAMMADYVANDGFPKRIRGLTGTPEQVAAAAKAYKVFYQKAGEGPDYLMNHSSIIYLMNPSGRFACVIRGDAPPDEIAAKVKSAMAQGRGAETC